MRGIPSSILSSCAKRPRRAAPKIREAVMPSRLDGMCLECERRRLGRGIAPSLILFCISPPSSDYLRFHVSSTAPCGDHTAAPYRHARVLRWAMYLEKSWKSKARGRTRYRQHAGQRTWKRSVHHLYAYVGQTPKRYWEYAFRQHLVGCSS